MSTAWIAFAALAALVAVGFVSGFLLLAMGRLHLDLGWGRSFHELGPIEVGVGAERELVFELLSAPYAGRASGNAEIELLATGGSLTVAAHHTKVHFYTARTVEAVELEAPSRIGFRLLTGPVPYAVEQFRLEPTPTGTAIHYEGQLGVDFFAPGRLAGRFWVCPQWERAVREHLEEVKEWAERRTASHARRERGAPRR